MVTKNLFSIITISGPDAHKFLQGQITANLDDLDNLTNLINNKYLLSAYCNLKGRVIAVFYISKNNNNYDLLFLGDTAEIFLKKIKKYSLFSKVSSSEINYLDSESNPEYNPENKNSEIIELININNLILNKIPIITKQTSELFLPDNINLINLNAVSFKKGCFLGQEIIARVYYKGKTKDKLYIININNKPDIYINPGEKILTSDHQNFTHVNNQNGINRSSNLAGCVLFSYNKLAYAVIEERFKNNKLFLADHTEISIIK